MIVFGVWAEIVQASFFCACVSSCCCCNTAIHRGHKVSLYLNQGNPDVAGLFTLLLSVYLFSVWIKEGFKDWDWDQGFYLFEGARLATWLLCLWNVERQSHSVV